LGFAQKRFMDVKLEKGYETLTFGGKPFFKDVDIPPAVVYGYKKDTIKFGEVTPMGFSEDGWISPEVGSGLHGVPRLHP
jgi:hypothetical protein